MHVYAEDCWKQVIFNCTFINNKGNIVIRGTAPVILIEISNTKIHDGRQSDQGIADCNGVDVRLGTILNSTLKIINCDLQRNQGGNFNLEKLYNFRNRANFTILIDNSTFRKSDDNGIRIKFGGNVNDYIAVTLQRSSFSKNNKSGLLLLDSSYLKIEDCIFDSNMDGIKLQKWNNYNNLWTEISNTTFINNSIAIILDLIYSNSIEAKISECRFTDHTSGYGVVAIINEDVTAIVTIEKSSFQGNRKLNGDMDCSVLSFESQSNITLSDINITNNNCTGIKLINSTIKLENLITLSGNHGQNGGGLSLSMSKLIFSTSSKLNIIENSADAYGGGIYLEEETCTSDNTCFFQLEEEYPSNSSEVIAFSRNHAKEGGDQMLGGCLSNCSIQFNKKKTPLSMCDLNNMFWDFVSSANTAFLGYQKKIAFCKNRSVSSASGFSCSYSNSIHVYRGQMFNVPLMVADDCCFPSSVEYIEVNIITTENDEKLPLQFKKSTTLKSRKKCHNYSFILKGGFELKTNTTIEYSTTQQGITPLILTVNLEECPIVYKEDSESGECVCHDILKSHKIECTPSKTLLLIPAQTWLGELFSNESDSIAVQNDCQFCKTEYVDLTIPIDSNELCLSNRKGIMCGACVSNYSLLLGGYECADCPGSTYKGVLLLILIIHCYWNSSSHTATWPRLDSVHWDGEWTDLLFQHRLLEQ